MKDPYRHTQINLATSVILVLSAALAASMLWGSLDPGAVTTPLSPLTLGCIGLYLVGVVLVWLAAYRLTIEVDSHFVRWRIGVGLLRDSHPLQRIKAAKLVAAPFSLFPRIRRMGTTRFVSVAPGRRGVELTLDDGRQIVLGTNRAEDLLEAIVAAKQT